MIVLGTLTLSSLKQGAHPEARRLERCEPRLYSFAKDPAKLVVIQPYLIELPTSTLQRPSSRRTMKCCRLVSGSRRGMSRPVTTAADWALCTRRH